MSWQAYVDQNLIGSGAVTAAGIYDLAGNPWAYSAGFAAQIAEVAFVSGHMAADAAGMAATGIVVAGVKYMFVSGDSNETYGKKGQEGVVFCRCARLTSPRHPPAPPRIRVPNRALRHELHSVAAAVALFLILNVVLDRSARAAQATRASWSVTTTTRSSPARPGMRLASLPTSSRSRTSKLDALLTTRGASSAR
jgi:profilin